MGIEGYNNINEIHRYYNSVVDDTYSLYDKMNALWTYTNTYGGCSFDTLDKYKENGSLDKIIDMYCSEELLNKLLDFLNILFNPSFDTFPYLRKLTLHESELVEIYRRFGYPLALYINNKEAYYQFPLYIRGLIDKYVIRYNKDQKEISFEELEKRLNKYMDLVYDYNSDNIFRITPMFRYPGNIKDYDKYEDKIINHTLSRDNIDEYSILAEQYAYEMEKNIISNYSEYNTDTIVKWISKDYGDGYGYDVLSYDPILKRQKVIEVKSSKFNNYELTKNEFKELQKMKDMENCDYYVYEYDFSIDNYVIYRILKYDPVKDKLIDTNTDIRYSLSPYFSYKDSNIIPKVYISIEPEGKVIKKV